MILNESSMTITVITPWYPNIADKVSGMFVLREVNAMKSAGMDVRVVHLDRTVPDGKVEQDYVEGHRVLRIGFRPNNPISVLRSVSPVRKAFEGSTVINSHAISSLPLVALARGKIPWVHTEHWSALSNPASAPLHLRAVRPIFASLLRLPDAVVAESERLAEPIRSYRGSKRVDLIPCIVPAIDELKERPQRGETVRLASTGGVIDRKDPLLAVRTLDELRSRGVEASLRWTGDGDLKEEAQALAGELGVAASFLGSGTEEDVRREIQAADVFIAPTKGENFFVAAAEALVGGRPLVASDKGGHTEYADPAFTEIVFERDPGAYADAVIALLKKTKNITAAEISASVVEKFSPPTVAAMYQELYQQVGVSS